MNAPQRRGACPGLSDPMPTGDGLLARLVPAPLFDTQVAAMVCGFGDQISYSELVQSISKVTLDKSSRFTDWSRRPLSDAQMVYALADVTHLAALYPKLRDRLEQ